MPNGFVCFGCKCWGKKRETYKNVDGIYMDFIRIASNFVEFAFACCVRFCSHFYSLPISLLCHVLLQFYLLSRMISAFFSERWARSHKKPICIKRSCNKKKRQLSLQILCRWLATFAITSLVTVLLGKCLPIAVASFFSRFLFRLLQQLPRTTLSSTNFNCYSTPLTWIMRNKSPKFRVFESAYFYLLVVR